MRASSTCCEIISTSCAKGCASTPKSRPNDGVRDPTRGATETAAALRDFNLAYVAGGSSVSDRPARGMSASLRKRTNGRRFDLSALCQKRTCAPQQTTALFDHLVGAREDGRRNVEAQPLGGPEVDDKFVLHRRLHQEI